MTKAKPDRNDIRKSLSSVYILAGGFTVIGLLLYYFWAVPYRAALSYREEMQLFQTTAGYFHTLASRPGGIAVYAGEFLTQFFNNFWLGAAVMTALLLLFTLFCFLICNRFSPSASRYANAALSAIPLISLLLFLGNPDVTVNFIISLLLSLAFALLIIDFSRKIKRRKALVGYVSMILFTTLLYWAAGPTAIIFTLLLVAFLCRKKGNSLLDKAAYTILSLACLAVNIGVWAPFLSYPLSYQLVGIGFIMTPDTLYTSQVIVEALCVIVPVASIWAPRLPQKAAVPALAVLEIIAFAILYPRFYPEVTYRLIDYDYMVRANDWDAILEYSDEHDPDLPLTVSATNLALGMTGRLDSRAFDYYQHGPEGLVPHFAKEPLSSWNTGEIFFQLGMVNSAQRCAFEGMEAIPNYNKSARAVKRLAETAIIRGDYTLAKKYLALLSHTLFYKKWAQRNLEIIRDEKAVKGHSLYGTLRKRMVDQNYLFSEGELDKTFGQLLLKDPGNSLARQYFILYPLLERDLDKFMQYMGVAAEEDPGYNPLLAQQAMAFISMKAGHAIPRNIVPEAVEQSLRDFAQAWTSKDASRIEPWRRSLYHYLLSEN